jgi:hypothetical protein
MQTGSVDVAGDTDTCVEHGTQTREKQLSASLELLTLV